MFERRRIPSRPRADGAPEGDSRARALPRAALATLLLTASTAAAPLRESAGLMVSCRIDGLPPHETVSAESALCARVIDAASRGAPYPVGAAPAGAAEGLRLHVDAAISRAAGPDRQLSLSMRLVRPGQAATAPALKAAGPAVAYADAAAVAAAIDTALTAVLPWRDARRSQVPGPPRDH